MEDNIEITNANHSDVLKWKEFYLKEGHSMHSTITYYNYISSFVGIGIEINQKSVEKYRDKHSSGVVSGALKNFFCFLVRKKSFSDSILHIHFYRTKLIKKKPQTLEPFEVDKIINYIGKVVGLKEKYFTIMLAGLGIRISECLKLKFNDFSWSTWLKDRTKHATVTLSNTKGGKFRVIPVSPIIMELLYSKGVSPNKSSEGIPIGGYSGLIFDFGIQEYITIDSKAKGSSIKDTESKKTKKRIFEENLYLYLSHSSERYRRILNKAVLETLGLIKKVHPHVFRHYRAQSLMDKGLGLEYLQSYLGHSNISSTSIYAQANPEILKREIEKIDNKPQEKAGEKDDA